MSHLDSNIAHDKVACVVHIQLLTSLHSLTPDTIRLSRLLYLTKLALNSSNLCILRLDFIYICEIQRLKPKIRKDLHLT